MSEQEGMSTTTAIYQTDSQDPVEQWIARCGWSLLNASATSSPIVSDSVILRMAVRELLTALAALEAARTENERLHTIARLYAMGHRMQSGGFEFCHCSPCEAYNRLLAGQPAAKEGTGG